VIRVWPQVVPAVSLKLEQALLEPALPKLANAEKDEWLDA